MVLGKLPVPGHPTIWMIVGQGPIALAVGAGGCCLDIFTLLYPFSPLSPSLWETARYRLKYCLKGPLNPKQPTNQPTSNDSPKFTQFNYKNIINGYSMGTSSCLPYHSTKGSIRVFMGIEIDAVCFETSLLHLHSPCENLFLKS